jgi:hypothetical protein
MKAESQRPAKTRKVSLRRFRRLKASGPHPFSDWNGKFVVTLVSSGQSDYERSKR